MRTNLGRTIWERQLTAKMKSNVSELSRLNRSRTRSAENYALKTMCEIKRSFFQSEKEECLRLASLKLKYNGVLA